MEVSPSLLFYPCRCGEYATEHRNKGAIEADELTVVPEACVELDMLSYCPTNAYGTVAFEFPVFPTRSQATVIIYFYAICFFKSKIRLSVNYRGVLSYISRNFSFSTLELPSQTSQIYPNTYGWFPATLIGSYPC